MTGPYVLEWLHAYRSGMSINAIAKAVGLSWLEVREIVRDRQGAKRPPKNEKYLHNNAYINV